MARQVINPAHVVSDVLSESLPFVHDVNIRSSLARLELSVGNHGSVMIDGSIVGGSVAMERIV